MVNAKPALKDIIKWMVLVCNAHLTVKSVQMRGDALHVKPDIHYQAKIVHFVL